MAGDRRTDPNRDRGHSKTPVAAKKFAVLYRLVYDQARGWLPAKAIFSWPLSAVFARLRNPAVENGPRAFKYFTLREG
jgi:hypothetical protein